VVKASTPQSFSTDTWLQASWQEFLALTAQPEYQEGRFYYEQGLMRLEMSPVDPNHGRNNSLIARVISLFATLKNIRIVEYTNVSYRKIGVRECQPDSSFYIGGEFKLPPATNSPVNLDEYDSPTLVIEVASTTLNDDIGRKRLLYERLGVTEYWVVDVNADQVIAFEMAEARSGQIFESKVLPGLIITLVEEVLKRSQTQEDGEINRWLLRMFG